MINNNRRPKPFSLLLVCLCLTVFCRQAHASDTPRYFFTQIDSRNGLSENNVKSIVQDHWGFLWFGTKNGLNRYDGFNIKHYDVDDRIKKQSNHNISALFEDRNHQIWAGTDKGVFVFNPYLETFSFFDVKAINGTRIKNWIAQITSDHDGNIWIVSPNEGVFRYNPKTKHMKQFRTASTPHSDYGIPVSLCVRKNGDIWIGTNLTGLYYLDRHTDHLVHILADKAGNSLKGKNIYALCDYGEWLAIGEHEDMLMKYNPKTNILIPFNVPDVHYKIIRSLLYDGRNLFVGTQDGLFIINESEKKVDHIQENSLQPYGLSDNMIYTLFEDRNHGIWIGTMYSGVDYLPRSGMVFNNYVPMHNGNSLSNRCVREMIGDRDGNIWIASEEGSLDIYNPRTHFFHALNLPMHKGGNNRLALMIDGDNVWSGIFKNGLDIINRKSHAFTHYSPRDLHLSEGSVYALFKDSKGRIWLGTGQGMYVKADGMKFSKINTLPDLFIQDIGEDRKGNIWIATMGNGVLCYNPTTARAKSYTVGSGGKSHISSNSVSSITFDHNGNPWFSTDRGGISMFNMKTRTFTSYSKKDGLPDDIAYKILEDKNNCLWFGTNQGLVRFNPHTKEVKTYRSTNGLTGNQYSYKSAVKTAFDTFLFGGVNGLVEFMPRLASRTNKYEHVYITNIRVNNHELRPGKEPFLKSNIVFSDEIKLNHDMANISFDVSSLNYSGIESVTYEYMLCGVDKGWMKTQNTQNISYSQLQPGKYTFKVRLAGNEASTATLNVDIRQPWWWSVFARIVYLLILCGVIFYAYQMQHRRQMRRLALREEKFREAKYKELLQDKINFFTDITHEIRTPLTLINGSVENIMEESREQAVKEEKPCAGQTADHENGIHKSSLTKNLNAISKNCKQLLILINQLLDFRKIDSNSIQLNMTDIDICQKLRDIIERFEPSISRMHKTISLDMEEDAIVIPVDSEAVTKIISNLLNNARKYSESFIQVQVHKVGDKLEIDVINDGKKIPKEKTEEIFQPFVQLDNLNTEPSSGIGLPLARSLSELHKGTLNVDTSSEYNKFVLLLPLAQDHVIALDRPSSETLDAKELAEENVVEEDYDFNGIDDFENTVLIVEDNADVRQMIADKLHDHYNIATATNGQEGLEKVRAQHIDIIISDIMMPVMDGLQFTAAVKGDMEINHIPIILLTAKQTLQSRIDSLKNGADAYIEKPFSFVHLLTQIEMLLNNRKRERENFIHKPYLPVQNSGINKLNEEFLNKISNLIMEHIRQPEFNVEQLAKAMCMSRSSLHCKIKECSNLTPIDFIRLIRLKKAAELIREHGYRANEVCDMVGISSASYFIKLFHRQFGITPKDFASQNKKN